MNWTGITVSRSTGNIEHIGEYHRFNQYNDGDRMNVDEVKDEILRQLMDRAKEAEYKADTSKSWFRRWKGIQLGINQSIEIIEEVYKEYEETEKHV